MDRVIKFRAWDKDDKKMWKVVAISESIWGDCEEKHIKVCDFDKSPSFKETDVRLSVNYELMQFTGLTDCNGVEIYEGDIVEHSSDGEDYQGSVIVYDEEEAMFCFENDAPNRLSLYTNLLVIGNIYEK